MPDSVLVRRADLSDDADASTYLAMLDAYASDPMGDGVPLADNVRERLIPGLRAHPTTLVWLAFDADEPIGVVTAFVGFSTFKAAPLINLHDVAVVPAARGRGVGRRLLAAVEEHARAIGCCRLTLEVLAGNPARRLYESVGFRQAEYGEGAGGALFFVKKM